MLPVRVRPGLGAAGGPDGDEERAEEQERCAADETAGEAVEEGRLRVQHELMALRSQLLADLLGRGERPTGLLADAGGKACGRVGHLGAVDAVHQAPQDGDPERTAELAGDVVDGRGDTLLAPRQRRHDRGRRRRTGEGHAGAEGQEAGEEVRVGRADLERREDDEAERHQRQAGRAGDTDADPRRDRGSLARERDDDESHRHERAGRLQRRVAHHELEVRKREEEEAEGREELDGHGEGSGGEAAPGEVPRVEHRLAAAQLPEHERHDSDDTERQ